ncbi:hypothetical protein ACTVR5_12230 [Serratia marcescens]
MPDRARRWPCDAGVPCGFPSPAQDYLEQRLSLDEICIRRPESTYL